MLDPIRVVAISDRRQMGETPDEFGAAIERAVHGCPPGSVLVQVREKDLDGKALLELIRVARRYTRVIVNDRVDVALAGADAVAVIRAAWTGDSLVPYVTAVDAGLALRDAR